MPAQVVCPFAVNLKMFSTCLQAGVIAHHNLLDSMLLFRWCLVRVMNGSTEWRRGLVSSQCKHVIYNVAFPSLKHSRLQINVNSLHYISALFDFTLFCFNLSFSWGFFPFCVQVCCKNRNKRMKTHLVADLWWFMLSDRVSGVSGALRDDLAPQGEMGKMEKMVSRGHLVFLDHRWAHSVHVNSM